MTVQLCDEDNFKDLTASECLLATGPGESFDNVPSATFSVLSERMKKRAAIGGVVRGLDRWWKRGGAT